MQMVTDQNKAAHNIAAKPPDREPRSPGTNPSGAPASHAALADEIVGLIQASRRLRLADAPAACRLARRAVDLAVKLDRVDLLAEAEHELGSVYATAGDAGESVRLLESAAERFAHDSSRRSESLRVLADVRGNLLNQPDLALQALDRALAAAEAVGDHDAKARVQGSRGTLLGRLGRRDEARVALEQSIEAIRGSDDHAFLGTQYVSLGLLHIECERYAEALATLSEGIPHAERAGERRIALTGKSSMAIALAGLGRGDDALALIEEVGASCAASDDQPARLQHPLDVARVRRLLDDLAGARRVLEEGCSPVATAGFCMLEVEFLEMLAETTEAMGDIAAALRYRKALREADRRGFDGEIAKKIASLATEMRLGEQERENALLLETQNRLEARVAERTAQLSAANAALRESEERFRDLAELSSDWFWEQDASLRFTLMSSEGLAKARYDAQAMLGKTRWELGIEGLTEAEWAEHKATLARREPFHNLVFRRRNLHGEMGWFTVSGKPVFDADGKFKGYRGTGRDITRRVQLEQQLRQTQKLDAMGRLAGGVAHEFNNIIAVVAGNSKLLRSDALLSEEASRHLDGIDMAVDRAAALVRQILAFSRGQRFEREPLALGPVVTEVAQFLRATLPAMIELRTTIEPGDHIVESSAIAIHQVLVNLGTNASHAMSGLGLLEIDLADVVADASMIEDVPALKPGRYVRITVRDNGVGMEPATVERIFEPFFTTKAPGHGTGLGLSVVHGIVHEHSGALAVTSAPGRGTTVDVYLPRIDRRAPSAQAEPRPVQRGSDERILFVDDDEALVFLARRLLERMGYRVEAFLDSQRALAALTEKPDGYDILVTDLAMPGMSGLDLAARALAIRPGLPIVIMSGYVREADSHRARQLGIGEICHKPSLVDVFANTIHARLSDRDREGSEG